MLLALIAGAIFLPKWKKRDARGVTDRRRAATLPTQDARRLDADLANYKL